MNSRTAIINMVKQQLRTGDVLDEAILDLYESIPRDVFVPEAYKGFAYSDMQIPLAHGQRMMTPLEEGKILQALNIRPHEVVLEVGTGSGFFTALLSKLAKEVISIDIEPDFTVQAKKHLEEYECHNVTLITGDACHGWLDKAPYDVVIFTGSIEGLTKTLRLQVLPGGRLFAPIGEAPVMQGQMHHLDHNDEWEISVLFDTELPSLVDRLKPKKEFIF